MKIDPRIKVYGQRTKGVCPSELEECQTAVNQTKKKYPHIMMFHIKNEQKRNKAQMDEAYSVGFIKGASDYCLVGNPVGFFEMKRTNYSHPLSAEQEDFLIKAQERGAFVAVTLGWVAFMQAVEDWHALQKL